MAEVTVFGAGIFGLSTAWACLQQGARVRVIDPRGPGGGASGGLVGALAPHVPENWNDKKAFQLDSLMQAGAFWSGVAQAGGRNPGYARSGRLQPLADDAAIALAKQREISAARLWGDAAQWRVVGPQEAGGWAPVSPTGHWVFDTLSARLHPQQACAALAAAITARGGRIKQGGDADPGSVVLWATGAAGLADLGQALNQNVGAPVKGQAALLDHRAPASAPQLFADGLHIIPHADGTTAVGSTTEREFDSAEQTDAQLEDVIARAKRNVPALAGSAVIKRWAGLRPRARSRAPLLGPWPGRPGHFVANGGFKIGFGMAPKCAEVMADLMLNGHDAIPPEFHTDCLS